MNAEDIERMIQESRDQGDFDEDWDETDVDANTQAALDEDDDTSS